MLEYKKRLARLAAKKREEIATLEKQLLEARAFLSGIEESIKALPRDPGAGSKMLRPGSKIARTRDAILEAGRPLHLDEILKALGEKLTQEAKMSLGGSLSTYVRRGEVFTRTGPNVFGLVEPQRKSRPIQLIPATEEPDDDDDSGFVAIEEDDDGAGSEFRPPDDDDDDVPF
jgi:hypothetical protein